MTAALRKAAERQRRAARGEVALSGWLTSSDHATLTQMARDSGMTQAQVVGRLIAYGRMAKSSGPIADTAPELLECLEGILAFTDGFGFYRTQSPAGKALEQWIEAARDAVSDATRHSDLTAAAGL